MEQCKEGSGSVRARSWEGGEGVGGQGSSSWALVSPSDPGFTSSHTSLFESFPFPTDQDCSPSPGPLRSTMPIAWHCTLEGVVASLPPHFLSWEIQHAGQLVFLTQEGKKSAPRGPQSAPGGLSNPASPPHSSAPWGYEHSRQWPFHTRFLSGGYVSCMNLYSPAASLPCAAQTCPRLASLTQS